MNSSLSPRPAQVTRASGLPPRNKTTHGKSTGKTHMTDELAGVEVSDDGQDQGGDSINKRAADVIMEGVEEPESNAMSGDEHAVSQ